MSLLLYAITEERAELARDGEGINAAPLRRINEGGLTAVVTEHEGVPAADEDTVWSFERAIEAEMTGGAVLPVRFGSVLSDASAVRGLLRARRGELLAQLDRVDAAVELSVRAFWPSAVPPEEAEPSVDASRTDGGSGTAYLLARLGSERRARDLADRLHEELDGLARDARYRVLLRPGVPVTAAFLVDHDRVEEFVARVQSLEATIDSAFLSCTGPWPAYSFVGGDDR